MAIDGVYVIKFELLGKVRVAAFIVTPALTSKIIVGMNIIIQERLMFDPARKAVVQQEKSAAAAATTTTWSKVVIVPAAEVAVEPREAHLVRCVLRDENGSKIAGPTVFVGEVQGMPIVGESDKEGGIRLYLNNAGDTRRVFSRGETVGLAEPGEEFRASPLTTHLAAAVLQATRKSTQEGKLKRTEMQQRIEEATIKQAPVAYQEKYAKLLSGYMDVISWQKEDIGHTTTVEHEVKLRDEEPVFTRQFPLPQEEYDLIRNSVSKWMKMGIIESSKSQFNSPIFCVKKKEGQGLRVVLDYRRLNAKSLPDRYSIRTVEDCICEVGYAGSKVFTSLDLKDGFWQMALKESSRPYTAFTVPGLGQYQ
jgi:hypothetical protein